MPYPLEGFLEIIVDMVQILVDVGGSFHREPEVENLFCGASSGFEPSLFFSSYLWGLSLDI